MGGLELFSIADVVAATGGHAIDVQVKSISGISIDSRTVADNALFIAIKGDRLDGHDFVRAAIGNGAGVALVAEARKSEFAGLPIIVVAETLKALGDIAVLARKRSDAKIVAVTGSVGKTSTKIAIDLVLSASGETHSSSKSFNNHWGVPLMLANLKKSARYGVFEIGMNHGGEITPLVEMVRPHLAVITNIGPAHMGNFDGIEGIVRAKGEIFSGLVEGGTAILCADHDQIDLLLDLAQENGVEHVVTYGFSERADVKITNAKYWEAGCSALITMGGESVKLSLGVSGAHMLANAVAALCVGLEAGVDLKTSARALSHLKISEGRGVTFLLGTKSNPLTVIDESYNANPTSMAAALEVFGQHKVPGGRKILVLGDMFELGQHGAELHAGLVENIINSGAEIVFLVGEQIEALGPVLVNEMELAGSVDGVEEIIDLVLNKLDYGDLIMVKGSNGLGLKRLVEAIRDRFAGGG